MPSPALPQALQNLQLTAVQLSRLDLYASTDTARDRNRWCVAHYAVRHCRPRELHAWLDGLEDQALADDMGERFDQCIANAKAAGMEVLGGLP